MDLKRAAKVAACFALTAVGVLSAITEIAVMDYAADIIAIAAGLLLSYKWTATK